MKRLWRINPTGALGLCLLGLVVAAALLAPVLAPHQPDVAHLLQRLKPPGYPGHPLGTDQLGRDELTRILYGARISLLIGTVTVLGAGTIGTVLGLIAGYGGGWWDAVIMRVADVQLSFPFVLLALTINAIIGLGLRNIIISLVISGWVVYARVVRGEVLRLREAEYVSAARVAGASHPRILTRHVLRNIVASLVVLSSLQVAQFILAEAAISFLGFGVQPPTPAWGNMLEEGEQYFWSAPWLITFPGLALLLTALAANLTGDLLRDAFDPRLRGRTAGAAAGPPAEAAAND